MASIMMLVSDLAVPTRAQASDRPGKQGQNELNGLLINAVRRQDLAAVGSLLHEGADANLIDDRVLNPHGQLIPHLKLPLLMEAVMVDKESTANTAIIQALLDYRANPNVRGICCGEVACPASFAMNYGHVATVHLLLERGANPNLFISRGFPIGGMEFRYIGMPLCYYSLTRGFVRLSNEDRVTLLSDMLMHGAQVDRRDADGNTALLWATNSGLWNAVPLLLAHHADVKARNRYGETALLNSVSDLTTLRLLLNHGAKINARNWKGETPLMETTHWVTPESIENKIAALRLLLSYGAAVDLKDRDGETALSRVMDEKPTPENLRIIALLKQAGAKELPANRRRIVHPVHFRS